jgi:hypothetical protein
MSGGELVMVIGAEQLRQVGIGDRRIHLDRRQV